MRRHGFTSALMRANRPFASSPDLVCRQLTSRSFLTFTTYIARLSSVVQRLTTVLVVNPFARHSNPATERTGSESNAVGSYYLLQASWLRARLMGFRLLREVDAVLSYVSMNVRYHHRSLSNGRCNTLYRSSSHVANCIDTWDIRHIGRDFESTASAGENKSFAIELDRSVNPTRVWLRADHHK